MKAESIGKKKLFFSCGSGILEVLIAVSIFTLGIIASTLLSFANQRIISDSNSAGEALYKASDMLEYTRVTSTNNFTFVGSTAALQDGIYTKTLDVPAAGITPCRKEAISHVHWSEEPARVHHIPLKTIFSDMQEMIARGGNCDINPPVDGYKHPTVYLSRDLGYHAGLSDNAAVNSSGGNHATDIQVFNTMAYMTAGVSAPAAQDDFFILDISHIATIHTPPPIKGSLHTGAGLNGLAVAHDYATGKTYAYTIQNSHTNQLQIIDVSDSAHPSLIPPVTLPNMISACSPVSSPCLAGKSIYYYAGKIYVGTAYVAFGLPHQNHEFHIYCVAADIRFGVCASSSPVHPVWLGSFNVNHNVNAIHIEGDYAYLATSDNAGELTILNIHDPTAIHGPGIKFDAPGNENGTSVFVMDNTVYLGRDRTPSTRKDFYILDVSRLPSIQIKGFKRLGLQQGRRITKIQISGKFAFLGVNDSAIGLRIADISNPAAVDTGSFVSAVNFLQKTAGLDIENGLIYIADEHNDTFRIIRPTQCADGVDNDSDANVDETDSQCHNDGDAAHYDSYDAQDDDELN